MLTGDPMAAMARVSSKVGKLRPGSTCWIPGYGTALINRHKNGRTELFLDGERRWFWSWCICRCEADVLEREGA